MKKPPRKILVTLLLCLMSLLFVPKPVYADGTYGDFNYTINNSTKEITITGYTSENPDVVIPAKINGYYVTTISTNAFKGNKTISSVSFENGNKFTSIAPYAFKECSNLKSFHFPESLTKIEGSAFDSCISLEEAIIPDSATDLCNWEQSGQGIFYGCTSLKKVKLPSKLTAIGGNIFNGCTSLTHIDIPESVIKLGSSCFANTGLTSVTLPDGITNVFQGSFEGCKSLKEVILSDNVDTLSWGAFSGCESLTDINIPLDLKSISNEVFKDCTSLEYLKFGDALTSITGWDELFQNCPKLTVYLVRGTKLETYCMNHNVPFVAYATSLSGCDIEGIVEKTYNGTAHTQNLVVSNGDDVLELDNDYTVSYSNNVNVGTASLEITGIGDYLGTVKKTFKISAADFSACKVSLSKKTLVYNTNYLKPAVTVTFKGNKVSDKNYNVSYINNRYVGLATVTVSGKGNFVNSQKLTFTIIPKATQISKVKAGKKSFKAYWKVNNIQNTGYQLQYSLKKNFSGAKTIKITNYFTKVKEIKKLKARKKYYVRIRCYKDIYGKKYYSTWSSVKSVKTK